MSLLVDYWLASHVGRWWFHVTRRHDSDANLSALCGAVARGEGVPSEDLLLAQGFAVRMWMVLTGIEVTTFGILIIGVSALPNASLRNHIADYLMIFMYLIPYGMMEIGVINYRGIVAERYIILGGPTAARKPMRSGRGLPKTYDFWLALSVSVVIVSCIWFALSH